MQQVTESELNALVQSNASVIAEFGATWCAPCKALEQILVKVAIENPSVHVVKVDVDEEYALAAQHHVRSTPTTIVFKNGAVVDTIVGMAAKSRFTQAL